MKGICSAFRKWGVILTPTCKRYGFDTQKRILSPFVFPLKGEYKYPSSFWHCRQLEKHTPVSSRYFSFAACNAGACSCFTAYTGTAGKQAVATAQQKRSTIYLRSNQYHYRKASGYRTAEEMEGFSICQDN